MLLFALAGCGDSISSPGSRPEAYSVQAGTTMTVTSITTAQYVKHINGVCQQAWGRILELFNDYRREHTGANRRERFAQAVQASLLPSITFLIFDDMRMLGAPPGEERELEEIIGPLQEASELGQKRRPALYSVAEIVDHFDLYNERARRYGLVDCLVNETHLRI